MTDRPPTCSCGRRGLFLAKVAANIRLCGRHYLLRLSLPQFPPTAAGQFVQLQCRFPQPQVSMREVDWPAARPPRFSQPELTDKEPLLRRPLSLAGRQDAGDRVELEIIYRVSGTGTAWLAGVQPGDPLSVLGPLGNAFPIRPDKPLGALVGGGVGIPPMIYLARALAQAGHAAVAFTGVRSGDLLPATLLPDMPPRTDGRPTLCLAEFARYGVPAAIATDDGSLGFAGLAAQPLERWLDEQKIGGDKLVVYSCGPEKMMQATAELCRARGIECLLSLERHMACGMGTCQSCVVKIRSDAEPGWVFKLCCTDGPVFDSRDVLW